MRFSEKLCLQTNKLFKKPVHPFNLNNDHRKTYAEWQFEKGHDTIKNYTAVTTTDAMFKDKNVLDIGCGAGGKTVFYASLGAKHTTGLEILEKYRDEAESLAREKGYGDRFTFVQGDAADMPFDDNSFDTIIMNDAMEHVDDPLATLNECYRVLAEDGKLYVNFPPYYHPYGAHLSDAIGFPWVHMFFSEKTLINVYKELVKDLPDGKDRIEFRISKDDHGEEYFSYINHMTIARFHKILPRTKFKVRYYREIPLRTVVVPLAKLPLFKEAFVKMVVVILEK
ncbi:MAG: class I SAM-dependent methyltransferase [Peptoniphilus sp.]|nr:class I SAM-dependent methyltransferase [Peptoniphilus sp.]MDD7363759.1 class I SAM-dependent methyltransferase [Bacillota bacterium]MDY6044600.1 class I SAM-dependent methyltransferase [Peptoniphilus sp.]